MMNRPILIALILILVSAAAVPAQRNTRLSESKNSAGDVLFGRVEALSDGNGVLVRWNTTFEKDVLGFEVLRSSGGVWKKAGTGFVPGSFLRSKPRTEQGLQYTLFDPEGGFGSPYIIRASTVSGESVTTGVIYPAFEDDLFSQTGRTSAEMKEAALSAEPVTVKRSPAFEYAGFSGLGNLPPNLPQQHWVAARPGVKIGVKENGLYRVMRTELENAGFDVNTDESLWQLYLDGNEQLIIVAENGDYIEFIGKGIDTPSTNTNVYFLVVGDDPGLRIEETFRKPNGANPALNYRENFFRRDRVFYVSSILNGDKENFFGQVISSTPSNVQFDLDEVDHSVPKTYIQIGVNGFTLGLHKISVSVNGVPLGSFSFTGATFKMADIGIPTQIINEGANTVQMTGIASGNDVSLVEFVAAQYPRGYVARSGGLEFPVPNFKQVTVTGFTDSNIRVFDMTSADHPILVGNAAVESLAKVGSGFQVVIPSSKGAPMFAVDDAGIKSPASIVLNEPSTLHSVSNAWPMVIISHADFLTESETWATYRTNDGIGAVAVDVVDVYDEFGFGRKGPDSIREFVNFARLNWSTPPGYAMLVGDATYDPRNYTGSGGIDFIPTDMVETSRDESPSDESLADYDEDGLSEIAIGRVPATTPTQVSNALTKVTIFESSIASAPARGALCASDVPQIVNFEEICNRAIAGLPESVPRTTVNKADTDARITLLAEMSEGKYVVNYSGHGSVVAWTSGGFFGTGDVNGLTNQNDLSIYTMLTCLNGYFINPNGQGLSERLFHATNGGAVTTWSSTGETTPDVQEVLGTRFYLQLGTNPSLNRMGDLVKDAKTVIVGSRDVRLSWHLLGDPALRVK
ncbi:MAG TPA: C25 family cysteine peptidase [Aridibacter sp.]|nr:C25 family cysteine peptidase [Aridibacter sp.]